MVRTLHVIDNLKLSVWFIEFVSTYIYISLVSQTEVTRS